MLKMFLVAFCVCFLLGAWQGWEEKAKTTEEEFLLSTASSHMRFVSDPGLLGFPEEDVVMTYSCNKATYFIYDLTTHHQIEWQHPTGRTSVISFEGVQRVIEGATGIKLFELSKAGIFVDANTAAGTYKNRNTIAAVLGSLSGYFAGFYVASRHRITCDSPQLVDKLRSAEFSSTVRKQFAKKRIEGLLLWVDHRVIPVVDVQDKIAPPPSHLTFEKAFPQSTAHLSEEMAYLRRQLSFLDYNPVYEDYVMARELPIQLMERLSASPDFFALQFPGRHEFRLSYEGPYDPNDILASFRRAARPSIDFLRLVIFLSFLSASAFLGVMLFIGIRERRKKVIYEVIDLD